MWLPFSPKIHQGNSKQKKNVTIRPVLCFFVPLGDTADSPTQEFPLGQLFHFTASFHLLQLGFPGRF